ncbi:MAG: hypothetical protein B7Z47_00870 [Chthoniobacter sp. 12-60-6]|nr:MAG: hypothetical protein B7Z47_00870 [Chthoniobacter sp. 12-60-6]
MRYDSLAMTVSTDSTALQIIRMINAPRERVYAAWTDADLAIQWWGPDGCVTEELILEAWRGGRFRWLLRTAEGEKVNIQGKYRVVHPPEKIVHTWQWIGAPEWKDAMSTVTVEFCEKEDNTVTELRLTHEKLLDELSRDNHINGWNNALDKLERLFEANSRV